MDQLQTSNGKTSPSLTLLQSLIIVSIRILLLADFKVSGFLQNYDMGWGVLNGFVPLLRDILT